MAADCVKEANSSLEATSWRMLHIAGKTFLVKGSFSSNSYRVLFGDLSVIWEEQTNEKQLLERSKSLNPYIEAPSSVIIQTLSRRILKGPLDDCTYNVTFNENELTVSVSGPLQGNTSPQYQWNFNLIIAPSLILKHELVHPLLAMSVELIRQKSKLIDIIERKDKEIKDYKENGSIISRKHLETATFNRNSFNEELVSSKEFQVSCSDPLQLIDLSWQELFGQCTNVAVQESSIQNSPVVTTTTIKSPSKRKLIESPSKDIEKSRRLELEKQLEDGKGKNKKKRKKLL